VAAKPWVVSDEFWERIEPLLPKVERRFRYPGRKRLPDRRELRQRGIGSDIARRQTKHGSGLGRIRWVVERTFAWLHHFTTARPLRPPPRDPRSLPCPRLLPRLLQTAPELIVIRVLSHRYGVGAEAT
jgi:transposase